MARVSIIQGERTQVHSEVDLDATLQLRNHRLIIEKETQRLELFTVSEQPEKY